MKKQWSVISVVLLSSILVAFVGNAQDVSKPQMVSTSIGIYDVKSRDEIHKFSTSEIRKLVQMEKERGHGLGTLPHPVLIYCFDEKSFQYTGGQYQDAEIQYRLHSPKNIRSGRKYPLIIHLHGNGESGVDNISSLIYLDSILPVLIGPESEDFFVLVTQCPSKTTGWSFHSAKDGTLDVLMAAMEHVIAENPIDKKRISITGVSSGGWGVWELLARYPDTFAGAVPTSCGAPSHLSRFSALKKTQVWSFINREDTMIDPESTRTVMRMINESGGSMLLTECDAPSHNAWIPAMDTYNSFRWMIAQKRGSWFSPPPGTVVHNKSKSFFPILLKFVFPLVIIVFLSWGTICGQVSSVWQAVRERLHKN
jgi:predicted esterase